MLAVLLGKPCSGNGSRATALAIMASADAIMDELLAWKMVVCVCVCVFFFSLSLVFVRVIGLDLKAERICYKAFMKCYGTAPLRLYTVSIGISDGSLSEMPLAMYLDTPSSYACLVRICSSEDALMGKHVVLRVGYLSGRGLVAFVGLPKCLNCAGGSMVETLFRQRLSPLRMAQMSYNSNASLVPPSSPFTLPSCVQKFTAPRHT